MVAEDVAFDRSKGKIQRKKNGKPHCSVLIANRSLLNGQRSLDHQSEIHNPHSEIIMMRFIEILRIAFDALLRNKMRSLLTML